MEDISIRSRNINDIAGITGNVYQSIILLAKVANKVGKEQKAELNDKLMEFSPAPDSPEELVENREQVEIAKHYEALPKPTIQAIDKLLEGDVDWSFDEDEV